MLKTFKYKLRPSLEQKRWFSCAFGSCRFAYNWAIKESIRQLSQSGNRPGPYSLHHELVVLKKVKGYEWLKDVPHACLQQAVNHTDKAFNAASQAGAWPKMKRKRERQSITFTKNAYVIHKDGVVRLPGIGKVRAHLSRHTHGIVKSICVVKKPHGDYFACVLVDSGVAAPPMAPVLSERTVGLDVGLKEFAVLSNGTRIPNPRYYQNTERRLGVLQRRLSRKKKGSKRRERAKLSVAKCHYRISCQRNDFLHKLSSQLVKNHDTLVIEDLNVEGMLKNHCLAKGISSVAWSEFFRQLQYKCEWSGKNLIRIGRFEPSSRLCTCGAVNRSLTLKDRAWKCPSCGEVHDRDLLAARNIKMFGLRKCGSIVQNTGEAIAGEDAEMPALAGSVKRQCAFVQLPDHLN